MSTDNNSNSSSNNSRQRRTIIGAKRNNNIQTTSSSSSGSSSNSNYVGNKSSRRIDFYTLLKRFLLFTIIVYGILVITFRTSSSSSSSPSWFSLTKTTSVPAPKEYCEFRNYPERRYYDLPNHKDKNNLPEFLNTEYIYGELPRIIQPNTQTTTSKSKSKSKQGIQNHQKQNKLCVDQTEWYPGSNEGNKEKNTSTSTTKEEKSLRKGIQSKETKQRLPFADGTNPSILKLMDNPRIDTSIRDLFSSKSILSISHQNNHDNDNDNVPYYLVTVCMTNSQCSWETSIQEQIDYNLSTQTEPSTVRTVLLVLNKNFETIHEATIKTRIDSLFGGRRNKRPVKITNELKMFALDDARLFTHKGQIWVSYREGKLFGYEKQVLNQLHFEFTPSSSLLTTATATSGGSGSGSDLTVTLLASETETLCCGRNMALIDNVKTDQLQALTWVDPVTVVDVEMKKENSENASNNNNNNNSSNGHSNPERRRLKEDKKKKSHFHGTNGFMVHLSERNEYLGIGHFHRPPDREKNEYAKFGHHYTHAFFTISDTSPFHLKRLSSELVLPSHAKPDDAEVIQFWSGLDRIDDTTLALAYGINDCEGAVTHLDLSTVEELLRDVPQGKEVVDFMMPLKD
ncbi:hypothetical protein FRACYDRAFT_236223 [Fragilariopsis cylindrus CCMP1102]|uniref:Uncharacterized protein n=1 Tax=Fragilariopsis cylindrus CCMP1102 TaxID=635003 RepID=A0A1E7FQT1_9STRA|nr:hypothetical protein FRACYDRAFT_236223 [Fragilariopsis cylindrus CCMP1102]|eukprot:OEU20153.1 hypothetical protein FRACYDRAFT_236223 [Fragilariopsis cylindrus CCMP1102]